MSIKERREEAEAVLDSAEMILETYGGSGKAARELKEKIHELEQELQDPESETALKELIEEIRDLMESLEDEPMDPVMGPGDEMGAGELGGPEDDIPPI